MRGVSPQLPRGKKKQNEELFLYSAPTGPYRIPPIFRKRKQELHLAVDCASYIFIDAGQVISIHYDAKRKQIFYQGHRIENMGLSPKIISHLYDFERKISKEAPDSSLYTSFFATLNGIILLYEAAERNKPEIK